MAFFETATPAPVTLPAGDREERVAYTGTACLAAMDAHFTAEVWEDFLYDGVDHDHAAGGLMINSASFGTHLEHDGDYPTVLVRDPGGKVVGFSVNLDPYASDLADVRAEAHAAEAHAHPHSHGEGHEHDHAHDHDHDGVDADAVGHGHHRDGWSEPTSVRLVSARALFGDPAGLPEADDTGGLLDLDFPAAGGELTISVYTEHGLRRELVAVWAS